jgi:hypothetical protein
VSAGTSARDADGQQMVVAAAVGAGPPKLGGTARPRVSVGHDVAHEGGDWIGIDDVLDCGPAIDRVGASEGPRGLECGFTGRRPLGKVGHPRQSLESNAG